ncbi:hypothetical protein E2C01_027906 [Portunus trituberculatus]|uniref:Uncharacterized protein n=1 Tax=Portunus trituberculatus TaxID=210409 RepID=A0A5B7EQ61_PORTR|nr:hypothetical protein [Portunus trituberculatus]
MASHITWHHPPDVTPHPPSRQLGHGLSGMVDAYMARRPWSARYTDARPPSATYIPIRERVARRVPRLQHPWSGITGETCDNPPEKPRIIKEGEASVRLRGICASHETVRLASQYFTRPHLCLATLGEPLGYGCLPDGAQMRPAFTGCRGGR